jgi:[acyl-carrier-protein] S-malonyltransferase
VISGSKAGILKAISLLSERGAKRAIELPVSGAFHSPLMKPAEEELAVAIRSTHFKTPIIPIFQNCTALMETDPQTIRENLIKQLTSPVLWTQTIRNMASAGVELYVEVGGNGKTLTSFVKKVNREFNTDSL